MKLCNIYNCKTCVFIKSCFINSQLSRIAAPRVECFSLWVFGFLDVDSQLHTGWFNNPESYHIFGMCAKTFGKPQRLDWGLSRFMWKKVKRACLCVGGPKTCINSWRCQLGNLCTRTTPSPLKAAIKNPGEEKTVRTFVQQPRPLSVAATSFPSRQPSTTCDRTVAGSESVALSEREERSRAGTPAWPSCHNLHGTKARVASQPSRSFPLLRCRSVYYTCRIVSRISLLTLLWQMCSEKGNRADIEHLFRQIKPLCPLGAL